jgi:trimeric autotransporter adhesin
MKYITALRCVATISFTLLLYLSAYGAPLSAPRVTQSTPIPYKATPYKKTPLPGYVASAFSIASVMLAPNALYSGQSSLGTVALSNPAPEGGYEVALTTDTPGLVTIPPKVYIPQGQQSGSFTATTVVATNGGTVRIIASLGAGREKVALLNIVAASTQATLSRFDSPSLALTSQSLNGTVYLNKPAPSSGANISLASGNTAMVAVQQTVVVPPGQTSQNFPIKTFTSTGSTTITVMHQGVSKTNTLEVRSGTKVESLKIQTPAKTSSQITGTIQIAASAPPEGVTIPLYIRNYRDLDVTIPPYVNVPAGQKSGSFTIQTYQKTGVAQIYTSISDYQADAACNEGRPSCSRLDVVPPPKLSSIKPQIMGCYKASGCELNTITAGNSFTLFIYTETPYVDSVTVNLLSSHPQVIQLPSQSTINAKNFYALIMPVPALTVTIPTTVTLTASHGGIIKTAQVKVLPGITMNGISVNPASIKGGSSTIGVVSLNQVAPTGGITINLASNNPTIVSVQKTITVPTGQSSASFSLTSQPVLTNVAITVNATYAGQQKVTTVNVVP